MSGLNSSFIPSRVDVSQDYYEQVDPATTGTPIGGTVTPLAGTQFNTIEVKNPSICDTLLVTVVIATPKGEDEKDGPFTESFTVCPGEVRNIGFNADIIQGATINVLAPVTTGTAHTAYSIGASADPNGYLVRTSLINC